MNATLRPTSVGELVEAVRSVSRLAVVGAQTKPRLSQVDAAKVCLTRLRGVIEYDPSEFTITAAAGTPLREIIEVLAQRNQYLPFDPMLAESGATIGGTVAAGLSGPGRFRFGGLRDFILGIRFVDGLGRLLRMGGKVVKNAAGFDLPKFFVGSIGRFGALADVTFKVFPRPAREVTIHLTGSDFALFQAGANTHWELAALDLLPDRRICLRVGACLAEKVLARWPGSILEGEAADAMWLWLREFRWAGSEAAVIKVPLPPAATGSVLKIIDTLDGAKIHVSSGGNVAFVALPAAAQIAVFDNQIRGLGLSGLMLRGAGPLWVGKREEFKIAADVKTALDPEGRFPSLDE